MQNECKNYSSKLSKLSILKQPAILTKFQATSLLFTPLKKWTRSQVQIEEQEEWASCSKWTKDWRNLQEPKREVKYSNHEAILNQIIIQERKRIASNLHVNVSFKIWNLQSYVYYTNQDINQNLQFYHYRGKSCLLNW